MNTFQNALADILRSYVLAEKYLLAPSVRVGRQWLDFLSLKGVPVLNVHVKTVSGFASQIAAPFLAGRSKVKRIHAEFAIRHALSNLAYDGSFFLGIGEDGKPAHPSLNLAQTAMNTIEAFRLAGVSPSDLSHDHFRNPKRGEELQRVFTEYLQFLRDGSFVDDADVLVLAREALDSFDCLPPDSLVICPADLDLRKLESDLLEAVPCDRFHSLPVDTPELTSPALVQDAGEQGESSAQPVIPKSLRKVELFHAVGEINEAREVLRRCMARGIAWDQVELLYTDPRTYIPLIYETFLRLCEDRPHDVEQIPVTFAEGIPVSYSRPGRALLGFLRWMQGNFAQADLVALMEDGLIDHPERAAAKKPGKPNVAPHREVSLAALASLLRSFRIGSGKDRHAKALGDYEKGLDSIDKTTPEHEFTHERFRILKLLVNGVLDAAPKDDSAEQLLEGCIAFLEKTARSLTELDNYARNLLSEVIAATLEAARAYPGLRSVEIMRWLEKTAQSSGVGGSGARPGALHAAHALTGGHSGRPYTFILGLDDSRFPGSGGADPIALDEERMRISERLPLGADLPDKVTAKTAGLFSSLRGELTLSYSRYDIVRDRERFPSELFLSAFRSVSGIADADFAEMIAQLPFPHVDGAAGDTGGSVSRMGTAASFAPYSEEECLDRAEWRLFQTADLPILNKDEALRAHFPHLARGLEATRKRASDIFTEFDGHIGSIDPKNDPFAEEGPVFSASGLEMMGRCPLAYFFRYVLKVRPPEESPDPTKWLDPLLFGSLMHDIFHKFGLYIAENGSPPSLSRDWKELAAIVRDRIKLWRSDYPPPDESAFRRDEELVLRTARLFLVGEEEFGRVPAYLETSVGMNPGDPPCDLDTPDPVEIAQAQGRRIRLKGRIDRIDAYNSDHGEVYAVWDYKTGGMHGYSLSDPFSAGRKLQHGIYHILASEALRRRTGRHADVVEFGYFFTAPKSGGRRLNYRTPELAAVRDILFNLCTLISMGAFPATNKVDDCTLCPYKPVCGDLERLAKWSAGKVANPSNPELDIFRRLREAKK